MNKRNKKERKGHNCSYVWWRRKFIIDMWESRARGRDILESPGHDQTKLGRKGERGRESSGERAGARRPKGTRRAGNPNGSYRKGSPCHALGCRVEGGGWYMPARRAL